jgi:hypothetical protein
MRNFLAEGTVRGLDISGIDDMRLPPLELPGEEGGEK